MSRRPVWLGEDHRRWDHVRIPIALFGRPGIGPYEIAAYNVLAAHVESVATGTSDATIADIASGIGCGTTRARQATLTLAAAGWVGLDPPDADERIQSGKPVRYVLLPPPTPTAGEGVASATPPCGEGVAPPTPTAGDRDPSVWRGGRVDRTVIKKLEIENHSSFDADVERLCALLADLIEQNGSKRPNVSKAWLTECDRLMRLDGRTPDQVERCIRWSQADPFWRVNILSMPKLRAKYDALRLAAKRQATPSRSSARDALDEYFGQAGIGS